jgi:Nucleotidyltransferase of unknown function (DUF6036)
VRAPADADLLARFMTALGREADRETRVYFTGGASAVLLGWRASTLDADIELVPESDTLLRAISRLKDELQLNVELASPAHFIPELPGWADRGVFIRREGRASFFHYDFYAQALSKIERGHVQDRSDVAEMLRRGLVDPAKLRELLAAIEPQIYRYPAVDARRLRSRLEEALTPAP